MMVCSIIVVLLGVLGGVDFAFVVVLLPDWPKIGKKSVVGSLNQQLFTRVNESTAAAIKTRSPEVQTKSARITDQAIS
jgi:hypothetical protein